MMTATCESCKSPVEVLECVSDAPHKFWGPHKHLCLQVVSSFLGVGAPEAFLVGVVALVVFGPQGLADVRLPYSLAVGRQCSWADSACGQIVLADTSLPSGTRWPWDDSAR